MFTKDQRGQTLILMLIVTVISLTIGVAISSRAISTLKQTSYTAQAGKAQKFSDAGIEHVLGLTDLAAEAASCPPTNHCFLDVDNDTINDTEYYVEQSGGGSDPITFASKQDETYEINLTSADLTQARISWDGDATIVYSIIHKDSSGNVTIQQRGASDPDESPLTCGLTGVVSDPLVSSPGVGAESYDHSITAPGLSVVAGEELYLRIRPLCSDADIQVEGLDSGGGPEPLPTQGYTITSTGTYGEAEWTAEVTKMNPALPAIFDYAIFSESDLTK